MAKQAPAQSKPGPATPEQLAVYEIFGRIDAANRALDGIKLAPVTIVIPACLKDLQDILWLEEALQSVFSQTVMCHCIIVENGSSFLVNYKSYPVDIIHSDKGLSKARNAGIKASNTEFFFPLDANDWLPPNAIETVLKKMPEKGFLYGSTMLFSGERGIGDQQLYEAQPYDFEKVMQYVYFPNGALQRKADWEAVGGYRESLPFLEDWDYWMKAGELGICGTAIQDTLYWYRQHGGIVQSLNKTPAWEETRELIKSYHAGIFRGVYPPMCCGNRNRDPQPEYSAPTQEEIVPGADGMVLIEYIGGNAGNMSWYGAVTATRYVAGGTKKRIYIDAQDATTGERSLPGFLELTDHGHPLFQLVAE